MLQQQSLFVYIFGLWILNQYDNIIWLYKYIFLRKNLWFTLFKLKSSIYFKRFMIYCLNSFLLNEL